MREINKRGLELVKSFEGIEDGDPTTVNLDPYMDPVGIWTIGWGHAIRYGSRFLRGQDDKEKAYALYSGGITLEQAETLLRSDLLESCRDVENAVKVELTDNQFAALVSFAFNLGIGSLQRSTLLKLLNQGLYNLASDKFLLWNKAGGKVLAGLTRRRLAEQDLFLA